jgi:hypothetical protein
MTIRTITKSSGHNTDNELVIYVHSDGYGYGQITTQGDSDDLDLKIVPKGDGKVEVTNLHVTGINGSIADKIESIESVLSSISVSGSNLNAISLSDKVVTLENEMDVTELNISDLQTQVVALSGINSTYGGGTVLNTIEAFQSKNNKIAFSFKVKEDKIVGIIPFEGLPTSSDVLGMTAYVEEEGKEYFATEKGWIALQAEGVYKTAKLTDDNISHSHYVTIGPIDAELLLFDKVEYIDIYSNEECVPVDHRHLVRWKKNGDGKIVPRILFDNHPNTPHLISIDEITSDIITTAVKNGLDENTVFQSCTLVEVDGISGENHTHFSSITVKQALELYKNQREFLRVETIQQSESNNGYYDIDAVKTVTGKPSYSLHKHFVTWKYEAGEVGIIRSEHLGQFSTSEKNTDELHNYKQYDYFGHIKPCSVSTNIPVEEGNTHIHEVTYEKSILNDIFTSLEVTKFNKTGGIIHGRVGIRDGFTYIDAEQPTISGSNYEMIFGTGSTSVSGSISGAPYWQHSDNDALKIGDSYISVLNNRNLGVGEFGYSVPTSADLHVKRNYKNTNVLIESKGGNVPSLELCTGTEESDLSGSVLGGKIFVNNSNELVFTDRPTGEVIFQNKLSNRGFSFANANDVGIVITGDGDLEIQGNLIVYGEASIINTSETHISDNIIELNSISGSANLTGSSLQVGFAFKRGPDKEDYFLLYNEETRSMVAGVSGVFNALPFHEGSIIEGAGIIYGSGVAGENVDTYSQDANNFRYTLADGLYIDASGDIGINMNNNKITNLLDGTERSHVVNLGQLTDAIDAIIQDHGELEGNEDDDHLQYIRTDGTRKFSGTVKYSTHPDYIDQYELTDVGYVDTKFNTLQSGLNSHSIRVDNPHNVTIEQLGGATFSQVVKFDNINTHINTDLQIMDATNKNVAYITSTAKGNFSIFEGSGNTWFGTGSLLMGISTNTINVNNKKLVNMSQGTNSNDGATLSQVDSVQNLFVAHRDNVFNPHNVTIEQLGGTTFSQQINIPNGTVASHAVNKGQLDSITIPLLDAQNNNIFSNNIKLRDQQTSLNSHIYELKVEGGQYKFMDQTGNNNVKVSFGGNFFDFHVQRAVNLSNGVNTTDAVNKGQLDAFSIEQIQGSTFSQNVIMSENLNVKKELILEDVSGATSNYNKLRSDSGVFRLYKNTTQTLVISDGAFDMVNKKIQRVSTGTSSTDATNLEQVQVIANGLQTQITGNYDRSFANQFTRIPDLQNQIDSNDVDISNIQGQISTLSFTGWEETIAIHDGLSTVNIPNSKEWDQSINSMLVFADGVKLSRDIDWKNNSTSTTTFTLLSEFSSGFTGEINMMRIL